MFYPKPIPLLKLVRCFSSAIDLIDPRLAHHHVRVASIASRIGERLDLPGDRLASLTAAGLLHDCGAISLNDRLRAMQYETEELEGFLFKHCEAGYILLKKLSPLKQAAEFVRHHHQPWLNGEGLQNELGEVPFESHILHLADRVDSVIDRHREILGQRKDITARIMADTGTLFAPEIIEAFCDVARSDAFWLDLIYTSSSPDFLASTQTTEIRLSEKSLLQFSEILSHIIDFRCRFTATHSSGVAAAAGVLSHLSGLCFDNCTRVEVAGYLHDLGKLAIPTEILEKPMGLTAAEFNLIKSHPYHTHRILRNVEELELINLWASLHHERLDGSGYPFGIRGCDLPLGSRLLAVADVFVALTEDRPYRTGMSIPDTMSVIKGMVKDGALDPQIVGLLDANRDKIDLARKEGQLRAEAAYEEFHYLLSQPPPAGFYS